MNGKELEIDEFEFELKEGDKVVATAKNTAGGLIRFLKLAIQQQEVYNYTITEKVGNKLGVTYDKTEHPATVEVKIMAQVNLLQQLQVKHQFSLITIKRNLRRLQSRLRKS